MMTRSRAKKQGIESTTSEGRMESVEDTVQGLPRVVHSPINFTPITPVTTTQGVVFSSTTMSTGASGPQIDNVNLHELLHRIKITEERQSAYENKFQQFEKDIFKQLEDQLVRDSQDTFQTIAELRREIAEEFSKFKTEISGLNSINREPTHANSQSPFSSLRHESVARSREPIQENRNNSNIPQISRPIGRIDESQTRSFMVKPKLPTFHGSTTERPPKFLRELERFIKIAQIPSGEIHIIIDQALSGTASEWWDLVSEQIESWNEFAKSFLLRFWSTSVQQKIRINLEQGTYSANSGISRVEYAMTLIGNARDLVPRRTDEEIVQSISRHFSQSIDDAVIGHNISSVEAFLALLDRWDYRSGVNQSNPRPSDISPRPFSNIQQAPPRTQNTYPTRQAFRPNTNGYPLRPPFQNNPRRNEQPYVSSPDRPYRNATPIRTTEPIQEEESTEETNHVDQGNSLGDFNNTN